MTAAEASTGYRAFGVPEVLCPDCWQVADENAVPEIPKKAPRKPRIVKEEP